MCGAAAPAAQPLQRPSLASSPRGAPRRAAFKVRPGAEAVTGGDRGLASSLGGARAPWPVFSAAREAKADRPRLDRRWPRDSALSLRAPTHSLGRARPGRGGSSAHPARMFAAGLAPFYASNFSLWSAAYCSSAGPGGCAFPLDPAAVKKPSFCIADILHAGVGEPGAAAEGLAGASAAALTAHLGSAHPHASFQAAARSPLRPTPVVAPSEVPAGFPQRLSPLSAAYHHHHPQQQQQQQPPQQPQPPPPPRAGALQPPVSGARVAPNPPHSGSAPAPSSKDLKFGIDRILSAEFDPKVKEGNTLRGRSWGRGCRPLTTALAHSLPGPRAIWDAFEYLHN